MMLRRRPDAAWLGLDLGTQSVRAILVSETGAILALGSHKLTSHRDGARHEQNPEEWWSAASIACRTALASLPAGLNIAGVAVDGTSGTILLVDGRGRALTPGGGEVPHQAAARAVCALHDIADAHPQGRILVVAHNTLIRLTLCSLFGIPLMRYRTVFPAINSGALTEIRFRDQDAALLQYNSSLVPLPDHAAPNRTP